MPAMYVAIQAVLSLYASGRTPGIEKKDDNRGAEVRLRDLPQLLDESTDSMIDTETPVRAHSSQDSDSEILKNVALPERPQDDKASLQTTQQRSQTSSRKVR